MKTKQIIIYIERVLQKMTVWKRWAFAIGWYMIITLISHLPAASSASTGVLVGGDDTLNASLRIFAHIAEFSILALLFYLAMYPHLTYLPRPTISTFGITLFCALGDECHQHFVPGRFARAQDVIVDTIGGVMMLVILLRIIKK